MFDKNEIVADTTFRTEGFSILSGKEQAEVFGYIAFLHEMGREEYPHYFPFYQTEESTMGHDGRLFSWMVQYYSVTQSCGRITDKKRRFVRVILNS